MADTLTHISLCAGIGGLDLGIKRVFPSVRTIAYVEREISACEILGSQMEKGNLDLAPIWTDVKTFPADSFRGKVDIVSGGYPCQPFSVAGQRRGTEDPRHLWPYIARIVDVIRPKICVFENVRGHVRLGLSEVLGELGRLGYRVRAGIFSAAEVGAPHRRERVFIMGYLSGSGLLPSTQSGIHSSKESARTWNGEPKRSSAMEHASRIAEREQDDKATTESRQDARTMSGGRRANNVADRRDSGFPCAGVESQCSEQIRQFGNKSPTRLAHSIGEGLQGHAGDGARRVRQKREIQESDRSVSKDGLLWREKH